MRCAGQAGAAYLQRVLSVVQTVHSEAVLQRGAAEGREEGQLQALGGCLGGGLPDQGVGAEALAEEVAGLRVQLHVARGGEVFLAHHHHVLRDKKEGAVAEPLMGGQGGAKSRAFTPEFDYSLSWSFLLSLTLLYFYFHSSSFSPLLCLPDNMLYLEDLHLAFFDLSRISVLGSI